jgi:hypothetical protein
VRPVLQRTSSFAELLLEDREEDFASLRRGEGSGRPVGAEEFVKGPERVLGRRIARPAPGRKPQSTIAGEQLDLLG